MKQQNTTSDNTLSIYYDGLCHLCSREIDHYRKQEGSNQFRFVDITHVDFDALKEGVDPVKVHKVMHVKNNKGIYTGVDSFIEIWRYLPKYKTAAVVAENPMIKLILKAGYSVFAVIRPYLPKKEADCNQSPYCEIKENKK
jgi:predicted DCC family thiol-disulfide oxidoreductase YuxK